MFCYIYIVVLYNSDCISILSYRQQKKRTIATLSLSLQSLYHPSLGVYIYTTVLIKSHCLLALAPPDWKWLSLAVLGSKPFQWVPTIPWRKSSQICDPNPELWLGTIPRQWFHRRFCPINGNHSAADTVPSGLMVFHILGQKFSWIFSFNQVDKVKSSWFFLLPPPRDVLHHKLAWMSSLLFPTWNHIKTIAWVELGWM